MAYDKLKTESYANVGGINLKASKYVTGPNEVLSLINFDLTKVGSWTKRPGTTQYVSSPVLGNITGLYEYTKLDGSSYLIATANLNIYTFQTGNYLSVNNQVAPYLFDFTTFVDRMFACNGNNFVKFDGTNTSFFSLPAGFISTFSASGSGSSLPRATYQYAFGYLNDRGYIGPGDPLGIPVTADGQVVTLNGLTTPVGFGISQIIIYRSAPDLSTPYEIARVSTGTTTFQDFGGELSANQMPTYLFFTLAPRFIEIYNNQLFMGGFSSVPSTTYFSTIGEPEGIGSTAFFETRTNDGDRLTGYKAYNSSLIIFKKNYFAQLTGTNPNNFSQRDVSDIYGGISNRAMIVYNDVLLFLDKKGICQYNGANVSIISNRVEPTFMRMNIAAAIDNAIMLHVKPRNEIWTAFPIDGATYNNHMVVYDYVADGFYEIDGPQFSSLTAMTGPFNQATPFYGDYSGLVHWFGASLTADNASGFSCVAMTAYKDGGMGYSVEKQFRQLFLDADITSMTLPVSIKFRQDEGASVVYGTTMYTGPFQSRIDFGIPAKTLSTEVGFFNATMPLRINGWTYASRFQRNV